MKCFNPKRINVSVPGTTLVVEKFVPCRKCEACVSSRARLWASRLEDELTLHDEACFITLTYDAEHLVSSSLIPRDVTLFLKRLRKCLAPSKIRYFFCGEYGETTMRPHYHGIVFGLSPERAKEILHDLWKFGFFYVGTCTGKSVCYVAGYVTKKLYDDPGFYVQYGLKPPFHRQSNRPGIGAGYLEKNRRDLLRDGFDVKNGCKVGLPDYYKKKLYSVERRADNLIASVVLEQDFMRELRNRYRGDSNGTFYSKAEKYKNDLDRQRAQAYRAVKKQKVARDCRDG